MQEDSLPQDEINKLLVDFIPIGMFAADKLGQIIFQNQIFQNLFDECVDFD